MDPELRTLLESIVARLDANDRRMDTLAEHMLRMDARFDAVDARFDAMDARFDAMDARFDAMDARFDRLQTEMREGFLSVAERFATLDMRITSLEGRLGRLDESISYRLDEGLLNRLEHIETVLNGLRLDMDRTGVELNRLNGRIDGFADDMRQRFRGVTERMVAIEQKLAA